MLWRGMEGVSLPTQSYSIVAYLDWLSFWRNAKAPSQLSYSAAGCEKKMFAWIAEKKMHSVFQRASTPSVERWLLRQILACDITTLLQRQLQHGLLAGQMEACYRRLIHPVCWAVYFSEGRSGKSNLTFISALSWQKSCGGEVGESTSGQYKSSRNRDWAATLRSLSI